MLRKLFLLALAIASTSAGKADVIVSTFGPGNTFSIFGSGIGDFPGPDRQVEVANSFTPTSSYLLDSISVAVGNSSPINQATVYLASGFAQPGSPIESFSLTDLPSIFVGGVTVGGGIVTVTSSLHSALNAGQRYWIVVSADNLARTTDVWLEGSSFLSGELKLQRDAVSFPTWHVPPDGPGLDQEAFAVTGSPVPEPATSSLILAGLVVFGIGIKWRSVTT